MADDAWLIRKQAKFLEEAIAIREVSIELLDCVSTLTKALVAEIGREGLAKLTNITHLMERTQDLLRESSEITGVGLPPSPSDMSQQEFHGLPNVEPDFSRRRVTPLRDRREGNTAHIPALLP